MESHPLVSIITATYNRSNVLRLTIEAVRASTIGDWEMIVVGDGCTDDTGDMVRSLEDPRITFFNLPENTGDQAAPNNAGIRRARGRYVAMLNHDDFWLPEHLQRGLDAIGDSDLVSAITVSIDHRDTTSLLGVSSSGGYEPWGFVPVSSWLMRRELAARIPWRPAREHHMVPSQEWLFRAWKAGATIRTTGRVTVIAIGSNGRAGSYSRRHIEEYSRMAELLRTDPDLIAHLLAPVAVRLTAEQSAVTPVPLLMRAVRILVRRLVLALGMHPHAVRQMLKLRRRGALLDQMRRTRGLSPLPRGEFQ